MQPFLSSIAPIGYRVPEPSVADVSIDRVSSDVTFPIETVHAATVPSTSPSENVPRVPPRSRKNSACIEEKEETEQEKQEHIKKLAEPRKKVSALPARLTQKKKVVAFGCTVNLSQTVEGTSLRERIAAATAKRLSPKPTMLGSKPNEEKENRLPTAKGAGPKLTESVAKKKDEMNQNTTPTVAAQSPEIQEIVGHLEDKFEKMLREQDEKWQKRFEQMAKSEPNGCDRPPSMNVTESSMGSRGGERRGDERTPRGESRSNTPSFSERDYDLLDRIQAKLESSSDFHRTVAEMVRKTAVIHVRGRSPLQREDRGVDRTRQGGRTMNRSGDESPLRGSNRNGGGFVTERMTLERSFVSPRGEPYSVDSRTFLSRRGLLDGERCSPSPYSPPVAPRGNATSHATAPAATAPQSYYQRGNSVAYYPENQPHIREVSDEEDEDVVGEVAQMTDEEYRRHCSSRENYLRNIPPFQLDSLALPRHGPPRNDSPMDERERNVEKRMQQLRRERGCR